MCPFCRAPFRTPPEHIVFPNGDNDVAETLANLRAFAARHGLLAARGPRARARARAPGAELATVSSPDDPGAVVQVASREDVNEAAARAFRTCAPRSLDVATREGRLALALALASEVDAPMASLHVDEPVVLFAEQDWHVHPFLGGRLFLRRIQAPFLRSPHNGSFERRYLPLTREERAWIIAVERFGAMALPRIWPSHMRIGGRLRTELRDNALAVHLARPRTESESETPGVVIVCMGIERRYSCMTMRWYGM